MKSQNEMMAELEKELMKHINQKIMDILRIKFSNQISSIVQIEIKDIIQYHLNETIWLDEMKQNLNSYIEDYTKNLEEQKKILNKRMDYIEQRLLDLMMIMEKHHLLIKLEA